MVNVRLEKGARECIMSVLSLCKDICVHVLKAELVARTERWKGWYSMCVSVHSSMHGCVCEKRRGTHTEFLSLLSLSNLSSPVRLPDRSDLALWTLFLKAQDNLVSCVPATWPRKLQNIKHRLSKHCTSHFVHFWGFLAPGLLPLQLCCSSMRWGKVRLCKLDFGAYWLCVHVRWNTAAECLLWQGNEWDRPEATGRGEKETHAHCGTDTHSHTYSTWQIWITSSLEPHTHASNK